MADQDDDRSAGCFLVWSKVPPEGGRHAKHSEQIRGDVPAGNLIRRQPLVADVEGAVEEEGHPGERPCGSPPVLEIAERYTLVTSLGVSSAEEHDLLGLRYRQIP